MTCDDDDWTPDPAEVVYLTTYDTEQRAIVAIGDADSVEAWKIGKAAGFSGGTTDDSAKQRANWASAVSKATRYRKKVLPHIQALKEKLAEFRKGGDTPQSVTWKQMLDRCDHLILHGTPAESLRAIELKTKLTGKRDDPLTKEQVVAATVARVGLEQARIGIEALAPNLLPILETVNAETIEVASLASINGADFKERLERLEERAT